MPGWCTRLGVPPTACLDGHGIRAAQELLRPLDLNTTMIYPPGVLNRGPDGVRTAADRMFSA